MDAGGRRSPKDELGVDILPDACNQVLTLHRTLKEGQNWRELGGSVPLLSCHVVAIDVVRAENWSALRAGDLVFLLYFFAVL